MALAYTYAAELAGGTLTSDTAALLAAHFLPATLLDGHAREGAESTLAELRRRDYCLGIVSNIEEDDLSASLDALGLRSCFDFTLSSEAAGSCKPDAEIFRQAIRLAGHTADETLFVGDTPAHDVDGAAALGMQTVLIRGPGEFATRNIEARHTPDHIISELPELLGILP